MCGSLFVVFFKRILQLECHTVTSRLRTSVKFPSHSYRYTVIFPVNRAAPPVRHICHTEFKSRRDAPQLAMSLRHRPTQSSQALPAPLRPRRRAAPHLPPPPPRRYEQTPNPSHTPPSTAPHAMPKKRARAATTIAPAATAAKSATCPATARVRAPVAVIDWRQHESRMQQQQAASARLATTAASSVTSRATAPSPLRAWRREFPCSLQLR